MTSRVGVKSRSSSSRHDNTLTPVITFVNSQQQALYRVVHGSQLAGAALSAPPLSGDYITVDVARDNSDRALLTCR